MRSNLDRIGANGLGVSPLGPAFDELKSLVVNATGHARLATRDDVLIDKLARRIDHHRLPSTAAYLDLLKSGPAGKAEFDCLIAELTVGETAFFRHIEHFNALRNHVLPACLQRNRDSRQLRIWSAGCANGAEAYSVAILVDALLGDRLADWNVTIVGSDINRALLAEAERGVYSEWTMREVSPENRAAFFVQQGASFAIRERYKRHVRFVTHNLASDEFPCLYKNIFSFDIIMCRNVMIYFDPSNNERLADRLQSVLVDGGWLFSGPTDFNPRLERNFALETVLNALVYRNRPHRLTATVSRMPAPPAASAKPLAASGARPSRRTLVVPRYRQPISASQHSIDTVIALANQADWPAAARHCEAVLAADRCNAPAHYYYALVQHHSGATAEAEQSLKRALYLDGNFALAHYQLGLLRKEARDATQCRRSLRNVLGALRGVSDDQPISPCGQITAFALRELAARQLELLGAPAAGDP